jgi:uncharacterized protein YjdB
VQDLFVSPKPVNYAFSATPDSAVVAVGDTVAPFTGTLTGDGKPIGHGLRVAVLQGGDVVRAESGGRIVVLGRGTARLRVEPQGVALPPGLPADTVAVWAVASRIQLSTVRSVDTAASLKDTLLLEATPVTARGAPIPGARVWWRQVSGTDVVSLLDTASGKVRAESNGTAEFEATVDTAHARRVVRVAQRPKSLVNTADTTVLNAVGHTHLLGTVVRDARANLVVGAAPAWQSKNTAVATVCCGGAVTAQGEGTTIVIASITGVSAAVADTTTVIVRRMRLGLVSGGGQVSTVGAAVAAPLVVQVVDSSGTALADSDIAVVFKVTGGGGHFGTADTVVAATDGQGRAQATPTLGPAPGPNTFTASGPGLAGGAVTFTASGAPGRRLKFSVEPTTIVAGGSFVPAPKVEIQDSFGNRVISATDSVTLAITAGTGAAGAKVAGTAIVAAVGGVATFGAVTVDKVGSGYTLTASASGLTPDTSAALNVGSGTPDHLAFKVPPRAARTGTAISPAVEVEVADATGNVVTSSTLEVTLSIGRVPQGGSSNYFGTPGVTAVGGVAVFNDFGLQTAASGYKLKASAPGLQPILSDLFDASGPPVTLQLVSGNAQGDTVRAVLRDSLVVRVLDAIGLGVPNDTIVFRVTAGGGSFGGKDSLVVVTGGGGRAAAALTLGSATGTDSVTAHSRSLAGQSAAFAATAVEAGLHLEFVVQPASITLGGAFGSPVQVRVRDGFMHTVTSATSTVTLAVTAGTGRAGAAVTGTVAVAAVNGVATFPGLGLSRSGVGYTLTATASSVYPATSAAFDVQQVPATLVKDWGDLQNSTVGTRLHNDFITLVLDAAGDPVPGDTVVYKVVSGVGTLYGGTDSAVAVTDAQGRAVATLTLGSSPSLVTVSARSSRLVGHSVTYTASATAAGRAVEFVTQPSTLIAGSAFSPVVQVRVFDPTTGTTDATAVTLITISQAYGLTLTGTKVVAAVNGIATFTGLGVVRPVGSGYRLQAGAWGLGSVVNSSTFEVVAGAPVRLAVTLAPAHPAAGERFWMQVTVQDANENTVPGATNVVTLAISAGTGTAGAHVRGAEPLAASDGGATFGYVNIDSVGTGYTLTASAVGLASAVTGPFDVWPAPPFRLAFARKPSGAVAGAPMSPAVDVLVQDSLGNTVASSNAAVSLTLGTNPGGGRLLGTGSFAAVGGVASFPDLRLRFAGTGYTLVATAQLLAQATSAAFDVSPAPASRLAFVTQPGNVPPGEAIVPSPQVWVEDSIGNVVTSSSAAVAVLITAGTGASGATLDGTTSVSVVNGVARFTGLRIATPGYNYTLTATSSGLANAVSGQFSIVTTASSRLVFKEMPSQLTAGAPAVVTVAAEDGSGARVTGFTGNVTLAVTEFTGTHGAHLRGTTTVAAVAGLATFSGISVDSAADKYSFTATAVGVASGTSAGFAVLAAPPVRLEWRVEPTSRTAGNLFSPAVQVVVRDSVGNLATAASTSVTLAITPGTGTAGASLDGETVSSTGSAGAAQFGSVSIRTAGTGYTLTASATGLPSITSGTFSIVAGNVSRVVITPDAASLSGSGATRQFAAQAFDQFDNPVSGAAISWNSWGYGFVWIDAATGLVTAKDAGQALIGASSGTGMGTAIVTVAVPEAIPVNLWARMPSGTTANLYNVAGGSSQDVNAVGQGGVFLRREGSGNWTSRASGTTATLTGIWAASPGVIAVSGTGGTLRSTGDAGMTWNEAATGTSDLLSAVWARAFAEYFAVGQGGRVIRYRGGGAGGVEQMTTGVSGWLYGVYGTSASNVIAVGGNGAVVRFDGTAWTPVTFPSTANLLAVWGTSANSMYAAGQGVYHWDGSAWSLMPGSPEASGIWGASDRDIYTVTGNGNIRRYDGTVWNAVTSPTTANLHGIWGTASGDVYAVGDSGTILRGVRGATVAVTATSQTLTALGATQRLVAEAHAPGNLLVDGVTFTWTSGNPAVAKVDSTGLVTAVANGSAIITATAPGGASGELGVTVRQVPASVTVVDPGNYYQSPRSKAASAEVRDARGNVIAGYPVIWRSTNPAIATVDPATGVVTAVSTGPTSIAAIAGEVVGYGGFSVYDEGSEPDVNLWAAMPSGTNQNLEAVWGASDNRVWAAGAGGALLQFDGSLWSPVAAGVSGDIHALGGVADTAVWAGLESGTVLHWNGRSWSQEATGNASALHGIWAVTPREVWAVGVGGKVLRFDGSNWSEHPSGTTNTLLAVHSGCCGEVLAVGEMGTVLQNWNPLPTGSTVSLTGIWGQKVDNSESYAVGSGGTILRGQVGWPAMASGTANGLWGVWGSRTFSLVYAVGDSGTVLHWDGLAWRSTVTGTTASLRGIWGTSQTVYVVGERGTILRGVRGATVNVAPANPTLTSLAATVRLSATARDATGYPVGGVTLTWASGNPSVAAVDPGTGIVTAVANGTATITATAPGGASGSTIVTVAQVAKTVGITTPGATLTGPGATTTFAAQAWDSLNHPIASPVVTWTSLNPGIATVDAATGVARALAPGQTTVAVASGSGVAYAVVTVAIPGMTRVNLWAPMASGTTDNLAGVWGTSTSDVFAVGGRTVLHYNGASWSQVFTTDYAFGLMGVWGSSSADVFASGSGGTVVHYDGTFWSVASGGTSGMLSRLWGASPVDVYASSWDGTIEHFNGSSWSPMTMDATVGKEGLWGASVRDVYATGQQLAWHFDGTSWNDVSTGINKFVKDVWGMSPADIYAAGLGNVFHYGGTGWTRILYDAPIEIRAIWGSSNTDVYFAGKGSGGQAAVVHFDGSSWTMMDNLASQQLEAIWGSPSGSVFAVGGAGTILQGFRGATVNVAPANPTLTSLAATVQLSATARDASNNLVSGATYTWTSDTPAVATVDPATGLVTAVAAGSATITATAPGGAAGSTTVSVSP